MPIVPSYNRQVEERGLPSVRDDTNANIEAFGGGTSADKMFGSAEELALGIGDIIAKEQYRVDKVRYDQSRIDLNKFDIENRYKWAANTEGEQAFGVQEELNNRLSKWAGEYRNRLANSRQKEAFDGLVAERRNDIDKWAVQHMDRQRDAVEKATYEASIESSKERAAIDQNNVPLELAQIGDTILERWRGKLPTEAIAKEIKDHESDLHERVVGSILSYGDVPGAKKYFDKYADGISDKKRGRIENNIRVVSERIEKQKVEQVEMESLNIIEKTKDFEKVPERFVEMLPRESRSALRSYAKSIGDGEKINTDFSVYYELKQKASDINGGRDKFAKENIMQYRDKLGDTEFKEIINLQAKIKSGSVGDDDSELNGFRTRYQVVNDVLLGAGIDPTPDPKRKEMAGKVASFRKQVDDRVMDFQKTHGKKANNEDVQRISDELMIKGKIEGSGLFGTSIMETKKMAFEVSPGEKFKVDVSVVPEDIAAEFKKAFLNNGVTATDEDIVMAWERLKRKRNINGN